MHVWVFEEALSKPTCENSTCHISTHLYIFVKSKIVSEHRNYLQNKENVRQRTKILLSRIQFFFAMIRFLKGTVSCYKGLSLVAMSLCAHYKKLLVQNEKVFVPREVLLQTFNTNGTMLLGITIGKKTPPERQTTFTDNCR